MECFRSSEAFLENYDMVFNIETAEGSVVTNAVMASVPNAAIWQCVFENLQVRPRWRCSKPDITVCLKEAASEVPALMMTC